MPRGMGRPMAALVLSDGERSFLEAQVRRHRVARSMSNRCRMILRCAEGLSNKAVAAEVGVSAHTVGKWRRRFLKNRIDGLLDEPLLARPSPAGIFPGAPALHAECRAGLVLRKCAEAAIKPEADFGGEPSRVSTAGVHVRVAYAVFSRLAASGRLLSHWSIWSERHPTARLLS